MTLTKATVKFAWTKSGEEAITQSYTRAAMVMAMVEFAHLGFSGVRERSYVEHTLKSE